MRQWLTTALVAVSVLGLLLGAALLGGLFNAIVDPMVVAFGEVQAVLPLSTRLLLDGSFVVGILLALSVMLALWVWRRKRMAFAAQIALLGAASVISSILLVSLSSTVSLHREVVEEQRRRAGRDTLLALCEEEEAALLRLVCPDHLTLTEHELDRGMDLYCRVPQATDPAELARPSFGDLVAQVEGPVLSYDDSDRLIAKICLVDGERHGVWLRWDPDTAEVVSRQEWERDLPRASAQRNGALAHFCSSSHSCDLALIEVIAVDDDENRWEPTLTATAIVERNLCDGSVAEDDERITVTQAGRVLDEHGPLRIGHRYVAALTGGWPHELRGHDEVEGAVPPVIEAYAGFCRETD